MDTGVRTQKVGGGQLPLQPDRSIRIFHCQPVIAQVKIRESAQEIGKRSIIAICDSPGKALNGVLFPAQVPKHVPVTLPGRSVQGIQASSSLEILKGFVQLSTVLEGARPTHVGAGESRIYVDG